MNSLHKEIEPFRVRHYISDQYPSIKGNGFDGIQIVGERDEVEALFQFINNNLKLSDKYAQDKST